MLKVMNSVELTGSEGSDVRIFFSKCSTYRSYNTCTNSIKTL